MIEYGSPGVHLGKLMSAFYSPGAGRVWAFTLGPDGRVVAREPLKDLRGEDIYIDRMLDLCEHPTQGHLYVAKYGEQGARDDGQMWFLRRGDKIRGDAYDTPSTSLAAKAQTDPALETSIRIFGDLSRLAADAERSGDVERGELVYRREELKTGGRLQLHFNSLHGLSLWSDGNVHDFTNPMLLDLRPGPYSFVFRIDRQKRGDRGLRIEVTVPRGSPAEVVPVAGP